MPNEGEVAIAPDCLTAPDIGLTDLAQRLQALNFSVSAGEIEAGGRRPRVQPVGEIVDLQQLHDLVLNADGLPMGDLPPVHLPSARLAMSRMPPSQPHVVLDIFPTRPAPRATVSPIVPRGTTDTLC